MKKQECSRRIKHLALIAQHSVLCLALCAMLLALCSSAEAQQAKKIPRIGFLSPDAPDAAAFRPRIDAFRQGFRDLGYVEGKNIIIEYRWAEGRAERLPDLAAELVSLKPDLIFTSSPQGAVAAKKATTTIPIVFVGVGDPVGLGLVASLAQPGGNVTGLTNFVVDLSGKRLEVLKESVPKISPVAVLWNSLNPGNALALKETEIAAQRFAIKLLVLEVRSPNDFDGAFQAATSGRAQALFPLPDPLITTQLRRILDFAAKNRLPGMYAGGFAEAGGLMSYSPDNRAMFRRGATYVDKILKGAKPADLPVEQPMKIEFVINLKTAKQIGLTIPPNVLARANKVIR
jgi:putative ABC transport system substrate-binding protein